MVRWVEDDQSTQAEHNVVLQYIVKHYNCREEREAVIKKPSKRTKKNEPPEPPKNGTPTTIYYFSLEGALELAEKSGINGPKLRRLEQELRERTCSQGDIGRTTYARALEKMGCFRSVFDYCRRNLN